MEESTVIEASKDLNLDSVVVNPCYDVGEEHNYTRDKKWKRSHSVEERHETCIKYVKRGDILSQWAIEAGMRDQWETIFRMVDENKKKREEAQATRTSE